MKNKPLLMSRMFISNMLGARSGFQQLCVLIGAFSGFVACRSAGALLVVCPYKGSSLRLWFFEFFCWTFAQSCFQVSAAPGAFLQTPGPHFGLACPGNKVHFQFAVMGCFFDI
jgi:hypothetical protein